MASGVDRISALPDDVLHQVLHFLPSQEVVRTCMLARRWLGVWRFMPALRFNGAKGWGSADKFAQFVDHLLHLRFGDDGGRCAPLDSCDFDFDADGFMRLPANERHASNWIWKVVPRVRMLRLRVVEFGQEPSPLSDLHLVSQHLTKLELGPSYVTETEGMYKPLGLSVASNCLKIVEIRCANVDWWSRILFDRDLKWCPTFTKLKTLLLNDWCLAADHNALICFLQHSLVLEKLTLQLSKGPSYVTETEGMYKPLGLSVASNCLKIVEIRCANVDSKVSILFAVVSAKTRGMMI
ncbi:F-box/LRR-repeat protein At2g42720-like [Aegilops tauschii subsp. strangulata]|uniref:F-box/LRR-repeat protein At2g42720-like n=1 Tax=Aegilops tauschii subsp. strangulata TaxID=200361 RepID=UPI001ABD10ED|nr:F-box/LRR-repeat protein At2g42720-like [Aegilops tauschii subsp. strangulata]